MCQYFPVSGQRSRDVPGDLAGATLGRAVRELWGLSWAKARDAISSEKVKVGGARETDWRREVRAGETIVLDWQAKRPARSKTLDPARIIHVDAHVVVVDKPPGVSTVPYDGEESDALNLWTERALARAPGPRGRRQGSPASLGIVHRIDKETSGLVVFTRTWLAKQSLGGQFRRHTTHRLYRAVAHGHVEPQTIESYLVENRGDGLRGSVKSHAPVRGARHAVTHVRAATHYPLASVLELQLETGRTHQIRIHLSESGHPLVGERVYVRGQDVGAIDAPRLMLHAAELGFEHPATGQLLRFDSEIPSDMRELIARLGQSASERARPPARPPARHEGRPERRDERARPKERQRKGPRRSRR